MKSMSLQLKYGSIYLADLNPRQGREPGKTRPVLIVQSQALLDAEHPTTLVIPLTTQLIDDAEPLRLRIKARDKLRKDSDLLVDQLRAIDNQRLLSSPLTHCDAVLMKRIHHALLEVLDISSGL